MKRLLIALLTMGVLYFSIGAYCDTSDTFVVFTGGTAIRTSEVNGNFQRLLGTFSPRLTTNGHRISNTYDLGEAGELWRNIYFGGNINLVSTAELNCLVGKTYILDITSEVDHNLLANRQGGETGQYYHFNAANHTTLGNLGSTWEVDSSGGASTKALLTGEAGLKSLTTIYTPSITFDDATVQSSAAQPTLIGSKEETPVAGHITLEAGNNIRITQTGQFITITGTIDTPIAGDQLASDIGFSTTGVITASAFGGSGALLTDIPGTALATDTDINMGTGVITASAFSGSGALLTSLPSAETIHTSNAPSGNTYIKWSGTEMEWAVGSGGGGGGGTPDAITIDYNTNGSLEVMDGGITSAKILNGTIAGGDLATNINISTTGYVTAGSVASTGNLSATGVTTLAATTIAGTLLTTGVTTLSGTTRITGALQTTGTVTSSGTSWYVTGTATHSGTTRITGALQTTGTVTNSGSSFYTTSPATFSGATTISGALVLSSITSGNITGVMSGDAACIMFCLPSDAYVGTNIDRIMIGRRFNATSVQVSVETAPTGTGITIEVTKNGTSIFSAVKPFISPAGITNTATCDSTFAVGDRIGWNITQIGSIEPGGDPVYLTIIGVKK